MRVQQVPNSPYFIHYDDEDYCCISKSRESQESIPESEMQEFLDAVANGLRRAKGKQRKTNKTNKGGESMVVYTKSGVTVNCCGNLFIASDGKTYNLCGRMLTCSGKVISCNCQSKEEALGTVVGLYGGRRF